ncbi:glycosyltransferase [Synechococcus sp. PCC 6716]|nr:glycosyltransferase [Synechococcus sp. PCC 6716]
MNSQIGRENPKISIGMPVYNGARYIREALDSLLAQTFTEFELIISDNASIDNTEAICREYAAKDHRVRYIRQSQNLGASANFKFVLDKALGEYFMWAAADDIWDKNWIEKLLPVSVEGQCIAFGMLITINENSQQIQHPANKRQFSFTGQKMLRRIKYFLEPSFLGKANPIYGIYPKTYLTTDILDILAGDQYGLDMLLLYRLLANVEIRNVSGVFLYKRIDSNFFDLNNNFAIKTAKKIMLKIIKLPFRVIYRRLYQMLQFIKMSNIPETVIYILLAPLILIQDFLCAVAIYLKNLKK